MKNLPLFAFVLTLATCSLFGAQAHAQRGVDIDLPDRSDLPMPDIDPQEYDYIVELAGAPQTGFLMINDRGVVRGPYDTYEEANDVGMGTPWVYFWVEEIEYQDWYHWATYDNSSEANQAVSWLREIGFWARVRKIPVFSLSKGETQTFLTKPNF